MIKIVEVTDDLREEYNSRLLEFESNFTYPLGDDMFSISHGNNYFRFFDLLGKPYIFLAITDSGQIIGAMAIILRNIDLSNNGSLDKIWYICDLKIHPKYRGRAIIQKIFHLAFTKYYRISQKIYAISMNSVDSKNNRLINLASRIPSLALKKQDDLLFYIVDKDQLKQLEPVLMKHDGYRKQGYLSLANIKDLILSSTRERLSVVHMAPENKSNYTAKDSDLYFMFCCPGQSYLKQDIEKLNIMPSSTGSIISNIECSWSFIASSEI